MIFLQLTYNLSLLIALSVLSGFIVQRSRITDLQKSILHGLLFGAVAVIGMLYPVHFAPGIIFDGRSVVISLCALFFGPVPVIITALMSAGLRIHQGGGGAVMGVSVITASALIGLLFHYKIFRSGKKVSISSLVLLGIFVHIAMVFLMFTLPQDIIWKTIGNIALPVMIIYPIATILIGKIISDNLEKSKFIASLKESEEKYKTLVEKQTEDIKELKQAQDDLNEKIVQYHNLANSSSALIWTAGTDKLCNYFNDTWLKFTGRTIEQESGNGWAEGVHPEDLDRCLKTHVTSFYKREKFEMEYRLRNAKGEYRWLLDIGTPNYDAKGDFIGYIGHCIDIDDRIRTEDEQKKKNEEMRQMNEIMIDRELRMVELKKEINELLKELGREPKY